MKQRIAALSLLAVLTSLVAWAGAAFAQDEATDSVPAHPRFTRLTPHLQPATEAPATQAPTIPLKTWNGSFVYQTKTFSFNMVGTAPSTGTSTTIPVFLIPVKMVYKTATFDPLTHKISNGQTVVQNILASPIFRAGIDFIQGGTNLGNTQYIDAFQRGNFWHTVSTHTGYHLLLGTPTVMPELSLTVGKNGRLATEFGIPVGVASINWFDAQLQGYMKAHPAIVPNSLPIFVTYEVYLANTASGSGCCVGGYHSAFGIVTAPQAYAYSTYIGTPGKFAQDVSALSHEVGEWADDPLVVNGGNPVPAACGAGAALEVGDPEEIFANAGAFPYTLGGFTYNLQDLVWLPYFGAPKTTSANGWLTFHGNPFGLGICSSGG